jgi:hypothetical protein
MRQPQVCDHSGGRFGMVTHHWWGNKFCKRTAKTHTSANLRSAEIRPAAGTAFLRGGRVEQSGPQADKRPESGVGVPFIAVTSRVLAIHRNEPTSSAEEGSVSALVPDEVRLAHARRFAALGAHAVECDVRSRPEPY